jgi:hypothetical protein
MINDASRKTILNSFMRATALTLKEFSQRKLHGKAYIVTVFHSWNQKLEEHNHTHSLFSAATRNAETGEIRNQGDFLFPVAALTKLFRGKFLNLLRQAVDSKDPKEKLIIDGPEGSSNRSNWYSFCGTLPRIWWGYIGKPMKTHNRILKYFARYANRIGITDSRIAKFSDSHVWLHPKRSKNIEPTPQDNNKKELDDGLIKLSLGQFVARFARLIPPLRFHRIRYSGLASSSSREARALAAERKAANKDQPVPERPKSCLGICPKCGSTDLELVVLPAPPIHPAEPPLSELAPLPFRAIPPSPTIDPKTTGPPPEQS